MFYVPWVPEANFHEVAPGPFDVILNLLFIGEIGEWVDGAFWSLGREALAFERLGPDGMALNTALAAQLRVQPGDTVLVRVPKPGRLSRDAPLSLAHGTKGAVRAAHSPDHLCDAGTGPSRRGVQSVECCVECDSYFH